MIIKALELKENAKGKVKRRKIHITNGNVKAKNQKVGNNSNGPGLVQKFQMEMVG